MRSLFFVIVGLSQCTPMPLQDVTSATASSHHARSESSCRNDLPDCAAACALRDTTHREFVALFEHRCAATLRGERVDEEKDGVISSSTPDAAQGQGDASPGLPFRPLDLTTISRTGPSEPPECIAARLLRGHRDTRNADMLDALCVAKGGISGL